MKRFLLKAIIILFLTPFVDAQQTVAFKSNDGVTVTADLFVSHTSNPYIILLHQAGSSRGEFKEIAPKLINLNYNCLAVDLRSGNEMNFVTNQTAISAKNLNRPISFLSALADIQAAISYVAAKTKRPIILLGSSYSASLALIEASNNFKVKAVIAFSPGEYFDDKQYVKNQTLRLFIPVLALSTVSEYNDMVDLLNHIPKKHLTLFRPTKVAGTHGAKALWGNSPGSDEYWLAISNFFGSVRLK